MPVKPPHILFATSELRPLVSAGGLGEAASGLVAALREIGHRVTIALPAYQPWKVAKGRVVELELPEWASPATVTIGMHAEAGELASVNVPGIERPDPYVDADGEGWPDNVDRFAAFGAAIAGVARSLDVDVVHLNDWHTAMAGAFLDDDVASVLTIHNLAHQGWADQQWLHRLPTRREAYRWGDGVNALAGAIASVDAVTTVSPHYVDEILEPEAGMGLHTRLGERADDLVGIRNGIDVRAWDPAIDAHAPRFSSAELAGKAEARAALLERAGWHDNGDPLIVMVTRLVEQKGVDLAFEAARFLGGMRARLLVLGSGDRRLADWGQWLAGEQPNRFWFYDGYDAPLSHELFAGGDLLLMPSRFEPCGLAQMQAMAYGTVPIVTAVGGLVDTVVDADASEVGNGFVAAALDESGVVDAIHRALRAVRNPARHRTIQLRGMTQDWSWTEPAKRYSELYRSLSP